MFRPCSDPVPSPLLRFNSMNQLALAAIMLAGTIPIAGILVIIFVITVVLTISVWWRTCALTYQLTEHCLRVRSCGVPHFTLQYNEIRYCEVVKAKVLWSLRTVMRTKRWFHTRYFVDGIIIHSVWGNYVLTPENPQEFCALIAHHQNHPNTKT